MSSRTPRAKQIESSEGGRRPDVGPGVGRFENRLECRLEIDAREADAPQLDAADFVELRRSIRVVRRLITGRLPLVKGLEAANGSGAPVDPLADDATGFCVNGAFLRASKPRPSLFVAWAELCHRAAGDLLGDPSADLFDYSDAAATRRCDLVALLDEVEARLDLLAQHLDVDGDG